MAGNHDEKDSSDRVFHLKFIQKTLKIIVLSVLREIRFTLRPTYEATPEIAMMNEDLKSYLKKVSSEQAVIEFGSGGSTLLIGSVARELISIESDLKFIKTLMPVINSQQHIKMIHANISPTSFYGKPLTITRPFYKRKFSNYSNLRKLTIDQTSITPGVIFIDGRFRVACFLQCLIEFNHSFTIIFDDYFDRPYYHIVENLLIKPFDKVNNTAIFKIDHFTNKTSAIKLLKDYIDDYR